MQFTNSKINKAAEEFKALCVDALNDSNETQLTLADACSTSQSTIAQYFSYNSFHHLPAFLIRFLPKTIALPLLRHLAASHGCDVLDKVLIVGMVNGTIDDEVVSMVQHLGEITKEAADNPTQFRRAAKHLPKMRELIERMEVELQRMEKGNS